MSGSNGKPLAVTEEVMREVTIRAGEPWAEQPADYGLDAATVAPPAPVNGNGNEGAPLRQAPKGAGALAHPPGVGSTAPFEGAPTSGAPGAPGAPPPKLRILDIEHMLATPPPPVPWVAEPLLVKGCMTMLAGREGRGKSMLALALASAIGHGANVAGFDCHPGRVLYVDAENGEHEAHRRVHGLGVKTGTLVYAEAQGFDLVKDVGLLIALVAEHSPDVVILDSFRSLSPGTDENDSGSCEIALRPLANMALNRHIPVLLLHHAGKGGDDYRGSTAIGSVPQLGFTLKRRAEDPERRTRRLLESWKSRPAADPEDKWLTLEPRDGLIYIGEAEPFLGDREQAHEDLHGEVLAVLHYEIPASGRSVATAVGRSPNDGSVARVLKELAGQGFANHDARGWVKAREDDALLDRAEQAARDYPELAETNE